MGMVFLSLPSFLGPGHSKDNLTNGGHVTFDNLIPGGGKGIKILLT